MSAPLSNKQNRLSWRSLTAAHWDIIFVIFACAFFFLLMAHDDLIETSNHTWILLNTIKNGEFLNYYHIVMEHQNDLYYINNAHYNIICYLLFGLWQLPVFLVHLVSGIAIDEHFLMFYSKAFIALAYGGCAFLMQKIARNQGQSQQDAHLSALSFALHPMTFFACFLMSQYDVLCLFFMLIALIFWQKNQLWRFSFWMGIALVFKFFPIFIFLPLLVLTEKRPLRCASYALAATWLYIPTALLFAGREGDMAVFNDIMIARVFAAVMPGSHYGTPAFATGYAIMLFACYLYRPRTEADRLALFPWIGVFSFGTLLLLIVWHPQWFILLVPFLVLAIMGQQHRAPWLYLNAIFCFGFFLSTNYIFNTLADQLFYHGIFGSVYAARREDANALAFYLSRIPFSRELTPVLFGAPILAFILFLLPYKGRSIGDRLAGDNTPLAAAPSVRVFIYGLFAAIIGGWFACSVFVLLKAL